MVYREIIAVCSEIHTKHTEMQNLSNKVATHATTAAPPTFRLLSPVASFNQHTTLRLSGQLCTGEKDQARHLRRSGLAITAAQGDTFH